MKSFRLIIGICLIYVLSQSSIKAEGFIFINSQIITSENKQYIFVRLSNENIDRHIKEVIAGWKEVDFTKSELAKSKKILLDEMQTERNIRQKYKVSGVFNADSDIPVHIVKDFPLGLDSVYVANNGSYVIGLKSHMPFDGINSNTTREELLSTSKPALTSIDVSGNEPLVCSAKAIDFVNEKYPISVAVHGFFWAFDAALNNDKNILEIQMLNREKILWDIKNCKILNNASQPSSGTVFDKENTQNSKCFSVAMLLIIISGIFSSAFLAKLHS